MSIVSAVILCTIEGAEGAIVMVADAKFMAVEAETLWKVPKRLSVQLLTPT